VLAEHIREEWVSFNGNLHRMEQKTKYNQKQN